MRFLSATLDLLEKRHLPTNICQHLEPPVIESIEVQAPQSLLIVSIVTA